VIPPSQLSLLFAKTLILPGKHNLETFSPFDIVYIEARHNNCIAYIKGRQGGITLSSNISTVLSKLPPELFCRIHKSYIIGIAHIKEINRPVTRVYYEQDKTLAVSETYANDLIEKFNRIK
jgi:two-component system, LytTR family, response regulator LytT